MKLVVGLVVLALALSGCILPGSSDGTECRSGDGLFVKAQHHPGFTGPDYQYMFYSLERDGTLTFFRANESMSGGGSGRVVVKAGALHNITAPQVRDEMERMGVFSTAKDFQVSVAWRDTVDPARFAAFCDEVLDEFYDYKARYVAENIADCDGFTFTITTTKGMHSSYSYCAAGPQGVRTAFQEMVRDAWERFGIEGL